MATLYPAVLFFLPFVTLYFQFPVSAGVGVPLGNACTTNTNCSTIVSNSECKGKKCHCAVPFYKQSNQCVAKILLGAPCNDSTPCKDGNATCLLRICKCNGSFYKDSNSGCTPRIYPNKPCANIIPKNDSCVDYAYCNERSVCVCGDGYTSISCIEAPHSDSSSPTVQTTVLKSTPDITSRLTGLKAIHSGSSDPTVQTTVPKSTPNITSNSTAKSAMTMAVVEIPTIILCFMLAYLDVSK